MVERMDGTCRLCRNRIPADSKTDRSMFGTKRNEGAMEWRQNYNYRIRGKVLLRGYKDVYAGAGREVLSGCFWELHREVMTLSTWFQAEVVS